MGTTPTSSLRALAGPTVRALGPVRTARVLGHLVRYLTLWSWRTPSPRRTAAMNAPMRVTEEPRRELRRLVPSVRAEPPADNDNAPHLLRQMGATDLQPRLPGIACPVLVMYGSRDAVMVAGGQILARNLRRATVHVLDDVGHELLVEAPDETLDQLRRFLH